MPGSAKKSQQPQEYLMVGLLLTRFQGPLLATCSRLMHTESTIENQFFLPHAPLKEKPRLKSGLFDNNIGVPKGIRTPVADVKGRCPWPTRRWGPFNFGMRIVECGIQINFFALRTANSALRTKKWWAVRDSNPRLSA